MPSPRHILKAAVPHLGGVVGVAGAGHIAEGGIVTGPGIGILNDGGQWRTAGNAVHQAAQKPGLVRLLPGGSGGIPARGPALEKAVQLLQVHPLPGGQAVHRHADGRGVGLAENGHMQIFTQI